MNIFSKFFQHNWLAILYFNFKMLPWKQAIHLPFDFYYGVKFKKLCGDIILDSDNVYRGMVKFGGRGSEMFSGHKVILNIVGKCEFRGQAEIGYGTFMHISNGAIVKFGEKVRIGALCKLYANKEIVFGDEIDVSWESQIFDTNFHEIKNLDDQKTITKDGIIRIGSFNWFGNRCNIMKGTITPNHLIVASNSLTNKDYTKDINPYSMLAGSPARLVKTNVQRLFEGVDL